MTQQSQSSIAFAKSIRSSTLRMVHKAKSSHVGSCFSMADIVAVLYSGALNVRPNEPKWKERDRFILSKGHACAIVYAALAEAGFFPKSDLEDYAQEGSALMAHISHKVTGVEFSTGSLGHGLPFGTGIALTGKLTGSSWRTFVIVGDGELDEGSNWEALLFAAHHKLDKLCVVVDANNLQSLTTTTETLNLGPLAQKLESFGARVIEIDGHDHSAIATALSSEPEAGSGPTVIIAHTLKGKGVDFMEGQVMWHYKSPSDVELEDALSQIGANK